MRISRLVMSILLPEGKVEVWYSGGKEVLKLLDGRLVGMVGTATEWLSVKLISPPAWGDQLDGMEYGAAGY